MLGDLFTSFSLGLLATASPCVLPLYPGFLAYLGGLGQAQSDPALPRAQIGRQAQAVLGLFVLAGVLTMMLALGGLLALLSVSIGAALRWAIPLADLAILALGVLLLLDRNPFKRLPQIEAPVLGHPFASAFAYGLMYGPLTLPCSGPLAVGIFAFSFSAEEAAGRLLTFVAFGLGFGVPLFALSLLSSAVQRRLTRFFAAHARAVNLVGGLLLVGVALYDLWLNRGLLLG